MSGFLTCALPEELDARLREFCARTKIPKTVIVREALDRLLETYKDHKEGRPFP
jgi:predicted DNA-binding protein